MAARGSFFVIAAHIPDDHNRALLRATIGSIDTHHPGEPTLVVDNASPSPGLVLSTLVPARMLVASRRQAVSHGMLGSWHEADIVLRAAESTSAGRGSKHERAILDGLPLAFVSRLRSGVTHVALLQHSTRLLRPLPFGALSGPCAAVALAGTQNTHGSDWLGRTSVSMRWASAKAHELRTPCGPQCAATRRPEPPPGVCSRWDECEDWSAALHSTILLTRSGFATLASYGLWPSMSAHGKLVHNTSFSRAAWGVAHGESVLTMPHAGLEILSGIVMARLNQWPHPPDRCQCVDCIEKRHGLTHQRQQGATAKR